MANVVTAENIPKPGEEKKAAGGSLVPRIIGAVIVFGVFGGMCLWGAIPFVLLTLVMAFIARFELVRAYRRLGIEPNALLSLMGAFAPALALGLPRPFEVGNPAASLPALLSLACALVVAGLWETGKANRAAQERAAQGLPDEEAIHTGRNMAYGLLCGAYVALFGGLALLRVSNWHEVGPLSQMLPWLGGGTGLVLLTSACTSAGDTGGFFVGRAAGKHKLAEALSPKKTTEGLIGGMIASVLMGLLMGYLLLGSPIFGLLVGVTAGVLGPMGDLFKSALKREIGIKDFGDLLPGHGGILDRFDSLLVTAPVVALLAVGR